ncbi:fungal-specific transcription factor domain-containing protein [Aspergillus floccosus]
MVENRKRAHRAPRVVQTNIQELIQRSKCMEQILKHKIKGIAMDTQSLAQLAEDLSRGRANETVTAPEPDEADDGLEIREGCTLDPVGNTTTRRQSLSILIRQYAYDETDFSGEFSYWNFSMRIKQHIEDRMHSSMVPTDDLVRISGYWRAQQLDASHGHMATAILCCPPEKIARFLATVFFKYTEPFYPIVDKEWVFDRIRILYTEYTSLHERGGEVTVAILLTVFAIGTQYAHLESPEPVKYHASDFSEEKIGATLYRNAVRLLPEIIEISSLESVQACLLFGVYALPVDASGLGYVYINLSIRLAMQNGMHRRCHGNAFSFEMAEARNRVWWTAYTLERCASRARNQMNGLLLMHDTEKFPYFTVPRCETGNEGQPLRHIARAIASLQLVYFLEDIFNQMQQFAIVPGNSDGIP